VRHEEQQGQGLFVWKCGVWAAGVARVACVGAPFICAVCGRRSAACSLRVLLAKRQEQSGEGLGLLLHASVVRRGAGGGGGGLG